MHQRAKTDPLGKVWKVPLGAQVTLRIKNSVWNAHLSNKKKTLLWNEIESQILILPIFNVYLTCCFDTKCVFNVIGLTFLRIVWHIPHLQQ